MDHTAQILALVGAILIPLSGAVAAWLRAVANNLADNNRGQNEAIRGLQKGMRELKEANGLPVEPPPSPSPRRAKRASRFYPRAVTPLPFLPVQQPNDKEEPDG